MTHPRYQMPVIRLVAAAAIILAACDLSVTNPGPVADGSLDSASARRAVVSGARRALAVVLNGTGSNPYGLAYWTAPVTYEMNPAGSTGTFGIPTYMQYGAFHADDNSWSDAQQARWVAEDGLRRFAKGAQADSALVDAGSLAKNRFPADSLLTALYLWAGYSNRLLGENFCDAVIDGGGKLDFKEFLARADTDFTQALAVANGLTIAAGNKANMVNAALAGRASVRMYMAYYNYGGVTWAQATTDASAVPNTFVFSMPYYDQDQNQYNAVYWSRGNGPYRAHTEWATYYENYYRTTRDPRVPWDSSGLTGDAAVQKFHGFPLVSSGDRVPFWGEGKYRARADAVKLSSGWEMRLIEAEAALVTGDTTTALSIINTRRAALNPAQPAVDGGGNGVAGVWMQLKRERMLELWLEARRLGDLRRWSTTGTPGYNIGTPGYGLAATLDGVWVTGEATPRETMADGSATGGPRDVCIPIGRNETQTNPNLQTP